MPRTAIVFASSLGGNTRKVAQYLAGKLFADIFDLKDQTVIDLSKYERVIFGTGVHAGKPYKPLLAFLEANRDTLEGKESVLFISCMYNDDKGAKQASKISDICKIPDVTFFPSRNTKKPEESEELKAFIERMGA